MLIEDNKTRHQRMITVPFGNFQGLYAAHFHAKLWSYSTDFPNRHLVLTCYLQSISIKQQRIKTQVKRELYSNYLTVCQSSEYLLARPCINSTQLKNTPETQLPQRDCMMV